MSIPRLKYFIQCDEVRNENGKFSALGLFDTIYTLVFPATHRRFFLLLGFMGDEGRHDLEAQFTGPDGRNLGKANGAVEIAVSSTMANVVFGFENFPLPCEGTYKISLFMDGDFHSEHTFRVQPPVPRRVRTPEEIGMLLVNPDIIKVANADLNCERCRTTYRFQHHLDPAVQPDAGFLKLPPGESFVCGVCGQQIPLKQLRENLENLVGIPRQWIQSAAQSNIGPEKPAAPPQPPSQ
ncbi:MAG: hypothetical protein K1X53_05020 [Candidatus Sumerlaeaceae bacterium]|nr:hypothetical protein [Candidatus Sumerlaeaceae bacterium]